MTCTGGTTERPTSAAPHIGSFPLVGGFRLSKRLWNIWEGTSTHWSTRAQSLTGKSWFPVLLAGIDALAVDCAEGAGQVWYSSIELSSARLIAPSLSDLFHRIVRAYETGVFLVVDGVVEAADEDRDELDLLEFDS